MKRGKIEPFFYDINLRKLIQKMSDSSSPSNHSLSHIQQLTPSESNQSERDSQDFNPQSCEINPSVKIPVMIGDGMRLSQLEMLPTLRQLDQSGKQIEFEKTLLDKYAPQNLNEIIGNQNVVQLFSDYAKRGDFPNMLLTGPTGCGKNSLITLFAKQILGPQYATHCLEIQGSLHRGRCIISQFGETGKNLDKGVPNILMFLKKSLGPPTTTTTRSFQKLIIIYDFDYTTSETQMSLRRIIEEYTKVKFIFSCNSLDNIKETIQSRVNIYNLVRISDVEIRQLIDRILREENLHFNANNNSNHDEIVQNLVSEANGNIRVAINTLQLIRYTSDLDLERFYQILNLPVTFQIETLFSHCLRGLEQEAIEILDNLITNGYSLVDLINLMLKVIINSQNPSFTTEIRNRIIEIITGFFIINETALTVTNLYCLTYRLLTIKLRDQA